MQGDGAQGVRDTWKNGGKRDQVILREGCGRKEVRAVNHNYPSDVSFIKAKVLREVFPKARKRMPA
jgi:hypothetical protein